MARIRQFNGFRVRQAGQKAARGVVVDQRVDAGEDGGHGNIERFSEAGRVKGAAGAGTPAAGDEE